jgi:hypothetical protein
MKLFRSKSGFTAPLVVVLTVMLVNLCWYADAFGRDESGLTLRLYTDRTNSRFNLGEPIKITMTLKNTSKWPVHTLRTFSESELPRSIIVTGPEGKFRPDPRELTADMPPSLSWKGQPVLEATTLPVDWARSVVITDITELIPVMKKKPGTYIIEAEQPFVRFFWTIEMDPVGRVGLKDDKNWQGTITSENQLKISITPDAGARFRVRVFDLSTGNLNPVHMIPVRIYRRSEIPDPSEELDLAEIWKKALPINTGKTDMGEGWVVWDKADLCMPKSDAGDYYLAIAEYMGGYAQVAFDPVADADGWLADCGGIITKRIVFGKEPEKYVAYATNKLVLQNKTVVNGGNIGATNIYNAASDIDLVIEENVYAQDEVKIIGDVVQLRSTANVYSVIYNSELINLGAEIRDNTYFPFSSDPDSPSYLPPWEPGVSGKVIPGNTDVLVFAGPAQTISPGDYGDIVIESNGILELQQGVYNLGNLSLGSGSELFCLGACEIRIADHLFPGTKAYLGPYPVSPPPVGDTSGPRPRDIIVYVAGEDGKVKNNKATLQNPEVAIIGEGNVIRANVYAPNGTLLIREGCLLEGTFTANNVVIGKKSILWLDSAW